MVNAAVQTVKPGQFVVGSFWATDNTCEICVAGYQSACLDRVPMGALVGAQADLLRVPLADGTLIATPEICARRDRARDRQQARPSRGDIADRLGNGRVG